MQGWTAWNITSDPEHGIGKWSVDELVTYLREGHAEGRGVASGPMREAVDYSLSHLDPADLRAMAVYLKTVPAVASGPVPRRDVQRVAAEKSSRPADLRRLVRELPPRAPATGYKHRWQH